MCAITSNNHAVSRIAKKRSDNKHLSLVYPVILVCGLKSESKYWLNFAEQLAQSTDVYIIDLFGNLKYLNYFKKYSTINNGKKLFNTLKKDSLLPCHLIGLNFAGMVCIETAKLASLAKVNPQEILDNFLSIAVLAGEKNNLLSSIKHFLANTTFNAKRALSVIERPMIYVTSTQNKFRSWQNLTRMWELNKKAEMHIVSELNQDLSIESSKKNADILLSYFYKIESKNPPKSPH